MGKPAPVQVRKTTSARRIARALAPAQLLLILSVLCWAGGVEGGNVMSMEVTSPAFDHGGTIPVKFTCDGLDVSPELFWRGFPDNTASFALACVDPDAPAGTWVHWVMYNIPASLTEMPEGAAPGRAGVAGTFGVNSWGVKEYGGPCPPGGVHRYYFKVFSLDAGLDLRPGASLEELEAAMAGHVLARGEIMGKYSRN